MSFRHISFNGVIVPYTYHCPYAHRLKNIERVQIEQPIEEEGEEISKRQRGINLHNDISAYLKGDIEDFPFITETVQLFTNGQLETQEFYTLDLSPLNSKPEEGMYVSCRKDAVLRTEYISKVADWKFGNPEYGISKYIDEGEFFLACEAALNPNISEWHLLIHFPEQDYTVPRNPYSAFDVARLQTQYINRIQVIISDKFLMPNPSRDRCFFCPYRSQENGGSGHCEFSVR